MQSLPHYYATQASGGPDGTVQVTAADRPALETAPPPEFGGPPDTWSPEHFLAAAVANCFVLSFRAVARASRLDWSSMTCDVEAELDRDGRVTRFTRFEVRPRLTLPAGVDREKAGKCLEKAKDNCLVTNSLNGEVALEPSISNEAADEAANG